MTILSSIFYAHRSRRGLHRDSLMVTGTGDLIISDMQGQVLLQCDTNAETEYSRYLPKCGMWV